MDSFVGKPLTPEKLRLALQAERTGRLQTEPPRAMPAEKTGNDSTMERKISGMLCIAMPKSEKKNDANWKNPDCPSCAPAAVTSAMVVASDAAKSAPKPTSLAISIRRSRRAMASNVLCAKSAGGCGLGAGHDGLFVLLARLPKMDVRIDEPRCDPKTRAVVGLVRTVGIHLLAVGDDLIVLDQHAADDVDVL